METSNLVVEARYMSTLRRHAFMEGDMSLCGIVHIDACDQLRMPKISTRLKLYLWPWDDLNYCQRCRRSLDRLGLVV